MENNSNINLDFKTKFTLFLKNNKKKLFSLIILFLVAIFFVTFMNIKKKKDRDLISEKFIQASINLNTENKDISTKILEEIILSKDEFYSIMALNIIIEKKLITNGEKILKFFDIIEKIKISKEQKDLIKLKKALYLIDISKREAGKKILIDLINSESKFKEIAKDIIN